MEIDHIDGIQNRLMVILDGITKVRDNLDLDKEELKNNVKKIGSEVKKIEKSFEYDGFEIIDVILEEMKFIKEEMRTGREELKSELKKLGESVEKLEKKCRRINGNSEDLQVRLSVALEAAKIAEKKLEEEKIKSKSNMELMEKMRERKRELEEKLESKSNMEEDSCSEKTEVSFSESKKSQELWQREGSDLLIKDYKVCEEVREFNFKKYVDENKVAQKSGEKNHWCWLEKQEDRMSNIVIKGLEVEEDKIVEQVNEFIELKLNVQIKILAGKYFVDKKNERALLIKLESEEDVEELMRRHKFGRDGIFIDYEEMTPQRELRKQLKLILEKQLKHTNGRQTKGLETLTSQLPIGPLQGHHIFQNVYAPHVFQ